MSRQPRKHSETGMYHIIFRGISRVNIFEDEKDFKKMYEVIQSQKEKMQFEIYAYCFMNNHVHLFLREKEIGDISKIMHKILTSYARWYNIKYLRTGILFENRYKSEPVEDERYFLGLIRYIHQNPVKANIVSAIEEYKWSSYNDYVKQKKALTDIDFALNMLDDKRKRAIKSFVELHETEETETYEICSRNNAKTRRMIMSEMGGKEPNTIALMSREERDETVKRLVDKGISKSALERETGISRGTIIRICNKK